VTSSTRCIPSRVIRLQDKDAGADLGTISEDALRFLVDQMEEEWTDDRDHYINRDELEIVKENCAQPAVVSLLESAIGEREGAGIAWSQA
jgi:hypothetical protein